MNATMVLLAYAASACLALGVLFVFHRRRWYWHILSVLAAAGLALMPPLVTPSSPGYDLGMGATLAFLFIWGLAAPFFPTHHVG
jgi:hypothetical protein